MRRIVAVVVLAASLIACDRARHDPLATYAASSCAALQAWVDAIEDLTTDLSHAVTPLEDASDRVGYYRIWARALEERTDDIIRPLRRLAPPAGSGVDASAIFLEALEKTRGVTGGLIALADSFPDGDDDPEPTVSRISSLLIRFEKGFSYATKARDTLAVRYPVFDEVPACVDYDNPVT